MVGSSQCLSSDFHPATNEAAERANAMVEQHLHCNVKHQQTYWADLLPLAEVAYNTVHSSTGFTPFQVATGREFVPIPECPQVAPEDLGLQEWVAWTQRVWKVVKEALWQSATGYKQQADKKQATTPFLQWPMGIPLHKISEIESALQETRPEVHQAFSHSEDY